MATICNPALEAAIKAEEDKLFPAFCAVCGMWRTCKRYRNLNICQRTKCWRSRKRTHEDDLYKRRTQRGR